MRKLVDVRLVIIQLIDILSLSLRSPPSWYPKDTPPPEQREREKDRVDALFNMTGKIKIIVGNELEF
jgi:hypothetical protein